MRLDKYLKVSRLIKRRTVANEACDNGLVTVNGKPARAGKAGRIFSPPLPYSWDREGRGMNDYNNAMSQAGHRLELIGRERLTVSGVEDVERFDETGIIMSTSVGTLVITGEDLHIGKLSLDGGELHVDGRIDSVSYEDGGQERGGLFHRLFG